MCTKERIKAQKRTYLVEPRALCRVFGVVIKTEDVGMVGVHLGDAKRIVELLHDFCAMCLRKYTNVSECVRKCTRMQAKAAMCLRKDTRCQNV